MSPFDELFQFKENIPSICGIRLGECYSDFSEFLTLLQDHNTCDYDLDYILKYYDIWIDFPCDDYISRILFEYYPYLSSKPHKEMQEVVSYFKKQFKHTKYTEHIEENYEDDYFGFDYEFVLSNKNHTITIKYNDGVTKVRIEITSPVECVESLQGANILYYHNPIGIYAVANSTIGLSMTRHAGTLTKDDIVENLIAAMKRSNDVGEDWYFDYEYSFLHKPGMYKGLEDESLLEDEDFMRECAEEMTDFNSCYGGQVEAILHNAGYGKELIPIEEVFRDLLLGGEITDLEEHIKDISGEWTLSQVLPYESLDY